MSWNKKDLWEIVKTAWYAIPVSACQKLVSIMPKTFSAVKKKKRICNKIFFQAVNPLTLLYIHNDPFVYTQ